MRCYANSKYCQVLDIKEDGHTYCAICGHKYNQPMTSGTTSTSHFRYHLFRYHQDVYEKINEKDPQPIATKSLEQSSSVNSLSLDLGMNREIKQEDFDAEPSASSSFNLDETSEGENLEKYLNGAKETSYGGLEHHQILELIRMVEMNGDLLYKRKNGDYKRKYMKERWFAKTGEALGVSAAIVEQAYKRLIRELLAQKKHQSMYGPGREHLISITFPYYNEMDFILRSWEIEKAERDLEAANTETSSEPKQKRPRFPTLNLNNETNKEESGEEIDLQPRIFGLDQLPKALTFLAPTPTSISISDHSELLFTLQQTQQSILEIHDHLKTLSSSQITDQEGYKEIIDKMEKKLKGKSTLERFSLILKVAQFIDSL